MANLLFNQFDGNSYQSYYGDINPSINKELNFNQNRLTNIGNPTSDNDAISKIYLESITNNLETKKITVGRLILNNLLNDTGQLSINSQDIPLEILQKSWSLELLFKNIVFESIPSNSNLYLICGSSASQGYGLSDVPQYSDPTPSITVSYILPFYALSIYQFYENEYGLTKSFGIAGTNYLVSITSSKAANISWLRFYIGRNYYCSGEIEINLKYSL